MYVYLRRLYLHYNWPDVYDRNDVVSTYGIAPEYKLVKSERQNVRVSQ
jgi:hypothetical protein